MSQSFQRFDDCFLLIAASSAERQKSGLKLLCRALDFSSLIAVSGVVIRAAMAIGSLGGHQLRASRENFHTSHLMNQAA